ncbi:MAG: aminotransferase class V-fold PLP-dependent enzyme [Bacteroidota bacterium]|nr:aminotransferase class V-fold PLP-dependent enzyme [Bacteroidota bacterium]
MSPLLKRVEEAGYHGISKKRLPHCIKQEDFFGLPATARALFAKLIHASSADTVTLLPSVSYGMAIVAKNLPVHKGQNIVAVAEEFPSNIYAWRHHCAQGMELRLITPPSIQDCYSSAHTRAELWNTRILNAIDTSTALVVVCPLHWADGTLFDLVRIGSAARSAGALFVVDGTQALGAMPFDVQQVQPDALIAASYKCMMGAYSIGCAYWGERLAHATPLEETWVGRLGSEDFRNLTAYEEEYQPGMNRLNMGEQSNFVLIPMLIAALEQVLEWTPTSVQEYCSVLTEPLVDFCTEYKLWIEHHSWRAHHLFGIRLPEHIDIATVQSSLARHNVYISLRGDSLRISPHVYNTPEDIQALIQALYEALSSHSYK